jgi:hypothetical protein
VEDKRRRVIKTSQNEISFVTNDVCDEKRRTAKKEFGIVTVIESGQKVKVSGGRVLFEEERWT